MATYPIKLKKELVEKIDYLVQLGRYPNRSTAIREIIEDRLARETYYLEGLSKTNEIIKPILQNLIKLDNFEIRLKSKKSATELVSEGRER